jgi:hypothetical protein
VTPNEIFTAALAKNRKNQPGIIATPAELFEQFRRYYPIFWTIGARVNPTFFGKIIDVPFSVPLGGWPRPADAESIYKIEDDGGEVIVVPFEETDADPFTPAIYEWGQVFFSAGNALDPIGTESLAESVEEALTFWYSKKPEIPADADTELEAQWPDTFDELLVLEHAIILALKDERVDEVALLRPERDAWLRRFIAHLEHATVGVTRSKGTAQRFTAQSYVPLNLLLAGGTDVEL